MDQRIATAVASSKVIRGVVISGRRKATGVLAPMADDLAQHLEGTKPVDGSLNIILNFPLRFCSKGAVAKDQFWPIKLNNLPCLAHRWPTCPLHVVEVISTRHLRTYFDLHDGSAVSIESADFQPIPMVDLAAWAALWAFRKKNYYKSDRYVAWTTRRIFLRPHTIQSGHH